MSDGHISLSGNVAKLAFTFSVKHSEYAQYFHTFFSYRGYASSKVLVPKKVLVKGNFYETITFYTFYFETFVILHKLFYREATELDRKKGRGNERFIKIIPDNIEELLTEQSLAIWFMVITHWS
jgi:hypothetical protein